MAKVTTEESVEYSAAKSKEFSARVAKTAADAINEVNETLTAHTENKNNPHGVTKAQVGLGNVENKSSATIRGELTKSNVTTALGFTPANKSTSGTVTIPTTGWSFDSTTGFPYYYDIAVTGVLATDRADLNIAIDSAVTAVQCGLCQQTSTIAGKIRVRSANIPKAAISADYWILKK